VAAPERPYQTWKSEDEGHLFMPFDFYLLLSGISQVRVFATGKDHSSSWNIGFMDA
jgi:hypothetical protein